jgi:2-oxoglutarate dehydrogenase E2 component (dihydrolipoamide succinyltransferase)
MANYEFVMPQMGEGLIEATLTRWLKQEGESVAEDEAVVEIATDKVDTEITSPVSGILVKKNYKEGDVVPIGKTIALIDTGKDAKAPAQVVTVETIAEKPKEKPVQQVVKQAATAPVTAAEEEKSPSRFYSPLVKNIALQENISMKELAGIPGTGKDDRLTKDDLLNWLKDRKKADRPLAATPVQPSVKPVRRGEDEVIPMDRVRQLIASHMSHSWEISPHVNSIVEVDMTPVIAWRQKHKDMLLERDGQKLTLTPFFIDAIAKAVRDVPMVNVSLEGTDIILHKNINIGMAVALPNNNLIVPVIKNADQKSLLGITKTVNDLSNRARINKLMPDDISGGTISITNLGSVGLVTGTPIINPPQSAIVTVGAVVKRPVVKETPEGDAIVIRHMMFLSLAHDHRVIDGALAGQFLGRLAFYLENFDMNQTI